LIAIGIAAAGIIAAIIIVASGVFGSNEPVIPQVENGLVLNTPEIVTTADEALNPAQIFESNKDAVFQVFLFIDGTHVGFGSGFFISSDGIAITNHHVMNGMNGAVAILYDGKEYDITGYYSYDVENDLAIIKVDGKGDSFQPVTLGNSDNVSVGDRVYAIGGPDGDPLTLTEGIISRFANEPISYGIYTVTGMLQTTAFIYGGNSGGPLFNDRGHVIGINSAGRIDRESTQWAVPIDRVTLPSAGSAINPLPVGVGTPDSVYVPGQIFYYDRYPFIPDFLSVSPNASLILSGTAADVGVDLVLDIDRTGLFNFDYAFYYSLGESHFIDDTDRYDEALRTRGFTFQGVEVASDDEIDVTYVFLYHPEQNISLAYSYYWDYEFLLILIGRGNAYERLSAIGVGRPDSRPDMPITELLYEDLVYDPTGIVLEIFWEDGRSTAFFYNHLTGDWDMNSREGGVSVVYPGFSFRDNTLLIGFPTTARVYNLFDDFTGFFGDERLTWRVHYD